MSLAAVILMKEQRIVERLRAAGATSPEAARPLDDLAGANGLAVRRLRRRAALRESPAGAYYLDEANWSALRGMRSRVVMVVLAVALAVALIATFGQGR